MLFNSFEFLAFFGVVAALSYVVPHKYRWVLLVAASLYFYSTFRPAYVLLLLGITLVAYASGLAIANCSAGRLRKALLIGGVALVLGALLLFKYSDFFIGSLEAALSTLGVGPVPLAPRIGLVVAVGLSFYTFSCVSYLIDVYAGRLAVERHIGHFVLYVSFFPKLLAGPIERAEPFLRQLHRPVSFNGERVATGLELMLWGLVKKVVIADRLAPFVDAAYGQPALSSVADLVLASYFFAFQLYCDFSGYSDIAIGAAGVLGFDLMENFRRPYLSTSVRDFWARRWHVSLTSWFRDYVYVPLGGNRVSRSRLCFNLMTVFLLSGLWHGAKWTFVIWGGLNGLYQAISVLTTDLRSRISTRLGLPLPVRSLIGAVMTFHLVLFTWVFFRAASFADAVTILSRVASSGSQLPRLLRIRLASPDILFSIALIAGLLVVEFLDEQRPLVERIRARPRAVRWAVYYALLAGLVAFGAWNRQQFVYMQF